MEYNLDGKMIGSMPLPVIQVKTIALEAVVKNGSTSDAEGIITQAQHIYEWLIKE
jgi:hypothetical protein